jgi:hypothetical protein
MQHALKWHVEPEATLVTLFGPTTSFTVKDWEYFKETRAAAEARILTSLKEEVRHYLNVKEQLAKEEGLEQKGTSWSPEHFDWLVQYQILRWSQAEVAKTYHRTRQTIQSAIHHVSQLLIGPKWRQWLRPPGRSGRPRRSS